MNDSLEEKSITITGQLDVSDELCSDGTAALSVTLDNGDEYIINNKKTVKRLYRMAYHQETLVFTGITKIDSTGLQVLSVQSCSKVIEQPEPTTPTYKKRDYKKNTSQKS